MKIILILFLAFLLNNCSTISLIQYDNITISQSNQLKNWQFKDIKLDSIPGISLDRAYQELIKNKKGKEIVVAVIDTEIDIKHKNLKNNIWVNKNEISNNDLDDDKNGYIDDMNGWNFLGYSKNKSLRYIKYEYVRIIKFYQNKFKDVNINKLENKYKKEYSIYKKALVTYEKELINVNKNIKQAKFLKETYPKSKTALKKIFPKEDYSIKELDSLYDIIKKTDSTLGKLVYYMSDYKKYKLTKKRILDFSNKYNNIFNKTININYNERGLIGDNELDIKDTNYGTNLVYEKVDTYSHGTNVSGVLINTMLSDFIKIMPIRNNSFGDYNDKDLALSIKYAVDNGAKIINFSAGKSFSLHNNWVVDAIMYAKKKDVLIFSSAGNQNKNIDNFTYYPIDYDKNNNELVDNFIKVGSSSYFIDNKIMSNYSNYGKQNVDIFAPGEKIYTAYPNDKYYFNSGTSLSTPIVSGVAALVMSYYPKLKAHQVKEILLVSGVSYNIDVEITGEDGKKKLVPFSSLSKSGKIVNAYNALLYAKNYKKWKAGKWPKK